MVAVGERPVERAQRAVDLGRGVGDDRRARRAEQERAGPAGVGVGARRVEQDGAVGAEAVGE